MEFYNFTTSGLFQLFPNYIDTASQKFVKSCINSFG